MAEKVNEQSSNIDSQDTSGTPLLVANVIVLHALNHFINGAIPVLFPPIQTEFNLSYVQLGFLRSATSFASGFPQMFIGLFRRWMSGRVLIGLGNLISSILNVFAGFVGSFQQFIALRVLGGIGGSPQHPIGTSMITKITNPSRRGRVLGINLAVPTLASTLSPLIAAWFLLKIGWRVTLSFLAVPGLILSLVMLLFFKGGVEADAKSRTFSFRGLFDALKNRNILAITMLRTVMAFRMGIRAFIPLYFINILGMSTGLSSTLYSLMILGGVVGPFFWGFLSDRTARKPLIILVLSVQGALYYSLQHVKSVILLVPILFLIGFMVQTVIMQNILAESTDKTRLEEVFGFFYTIGFTLGSISSIIFSFIVEILGFNYGFTYIAAVTAFSLIPAFFIKEHKTPINALPGI